MARVSFTQNIQRHVACPASDAAGTNVGEVLDAVFAANQRARTYVLDETGERLAFGSTTGSLWISEDQGDTWQTFSEHLPPVYCVRFVK